MSPPRSRGPTRAERIRAEKLEEVAAMVAAGELTIRQATADEVERYGIKTNAEAQS